MLKKLKQYTHEEFVQNDLPFSITRLSPGIGAIIEGINFTIIDINKAYNLMLNELKHSKSLIYPEKIKK